jgi:hypothetical protein
MVGDRHQRNAPADLIRIGGEGQKRRPGFTRFGFLLVVFMRIVAVLWMFQGLMQWQIILAPEGPPLDALPMPVATAVGFFAVADLLAAVGLWLASPWGGVLWIFSASASIVVSLFMPEFHAGGRTVMVLIFVLIVSYFVLTWLAAREREF